MKRVLSIDFDYFVNATSRQRTLFPDGGFEYSQEVNRIVWVMTYAGPVNRWAGKLSSVSVFEEPLGIVQDILLHHLTKDFMIADSHVHAYQFIKDHLAPGETAEVYNVDFHHDTYPGTELHCGNWLRLLIEEGTVRQKDAYWVNQGEDSDAEYNMAQIIPLEKLPAEGYDLIFICRSSWWTPPHLDEYFIRFLVRPLLDNAVAGSYEKDIDKSRYDDAFQADVESYRKVLKATALMQRRKSGS